MPFFTRKKEGAVNTPPAPKYKPLDLPTFGEGEIEVPPFAPSWASSDSSGSSVASSLPSTPASSPAPWRRPFTPHRAPAARSQTPQEMHAPAWHVAHHPEPEMSLYRKALTPSPEIFKPRPRRASSAHQPSPVQVMQGLVSPSPMPMPASKSGPLKGILKQTVPRSAASTPAPTLRTNEIKLHWQLIPSSTHRAVRPLEVEFDLRKPIEDIVIRDHRLQFHSKLPQSEVNLYLSRKVCEHPPLRQMEIHYQLFPGWKVIVKRKDGGVLQVRDVFEAIYEDLQKLPTRQERAMYMKDPKATSAAFIRRCEESTRTVYLAEQKAGLRRVDLLVGESLFKGLTRPEKDGQDFWIAHFGARNPDSPQ